MSENNNNSQNNKRKRAVNFTELEVRVLIDIVIKYMHVVENKTSDAVTWREKQNVWQDIAKEFNAFIGQNNRSAKELRLKYECIKKKIKKKKSHNKSEFFKTGGGVAHNEEFTDYEIKILNHIVLSVDGLLPQDDCDADYLEETQNIAKGNKSDAKTDTDDGWIDELKDSIHENLVDFEDTKENKCNDNSRDSSLEMNSHDIKKKKKCNDDNLECSNLHPNNINKKNKELIHQASSKTWGQWNSSQLKTAKHKALSATKKTKSKPVQKDTLNTKIATVADSRQELLLLQIDIAKNEEERRVAEHTEKLKNLKFEGKGIQDRNELLAKENQLIELKIENEELKQQLLQLELQNH